jgi:predicted metal-dependent peptidase
VTRAPRQVSPEDASRFFLLAWGMRIHPALPEILREPLGGLEAAKKALAAWRPLPLEIGAPLPDTLPGGLPIPPARTPWPRQDSPFPGVDLPVDETLALAWEVLWARLHSREFAPLGAVKRLHALAGGCVGVSRCRLLIAGWRNNGHALACIRAAHPPQTPPRLTPADQRAFLAAARRGSAGHEHNWRLLVRAGFDPQPALDLARSFDPASGLLPDGQRIPPAQEDGPGGPPPAAWGPGSMPAGPQGWTTARLFVYECLDSLVLDRPLHWLLLSGARIVEDPTAPTFAVGLTRRQELVLFFSPTFALELSVEECKGVLCHEINHFLFGHLGPRPPGVDRHRAAWTIATEVTANEYVPYPLPGEPLTLRQFRLPPHESTLDRYHRLAGRELPPVATLDVVIEEPLAPEPGRADEGGGERPDRSLPEILGEAVARVGASLDPETRASLGRHPGTLPGMQASLLDPPGVSKLPWRCLLQRLVRSIHSHESVRHWPSRRHPDLLGVVPGRRRRRTERRILVAIDTSGSMSRAELSEASDELSQILRQHVRVAVVQCDTQIHREAWLSPGERLNGVVGRGGTDLRPPFERAVIDRYKPGLLVYFTDGEGPAPAAAPPGLPVLWVLTGDHPAAPADWGHVVCQRDPSLRAPVRRWGA